MPHTRRWLPWAGMAVAPFIAFLLLREGVLSDASFAAPTFHFFIVSLTSLVACFMAGLLVIAAGQLRDARVVFLSLAFLGIAGIFAVHGLTTPTSSSKAETRGSASPRGSACWLARSSSR